MSSAVDVPTRDAPAISLRQRAVLGLLAVACVAFHGRPGKPIWTDECLQFVMGAFTSGAEAWGVVRKTVRDINHGQTGAYLMADHGLLRVFGAGRFWLRLPSLLSGLVLFAAALALFDRWGLPFAWRVWGCLGLYTQPWITEHLAEARPYMPLAAATAGALAYYSIPLEERRGWGARSLGWGSVLLGALFHPYFSVYWLFVCGLTYGAGLWRRRERPTLKGLLGHANPPLVGVGAGAYFAIGMLTWMPHQGRHSFDPFQYTGAGFQAVRSFVLVHLGLMNYLRGPLTALVLVVAGIVMVGKGARVAKGNVFMPLVLAASGFLLSFFFSYLSWRRGYWILPRQWVASLCLIAVALPWAAYGVASVLRPGHRLAWSLLLWAGLSIGVVGTTTNEIRRAIQAPKPGVMPVGFSPEKVTPPSTVQGWVDMANLNCDYGGPVWPVFRRFYGFPSSSAEK